MSRGAEQSQQHSHDAHDADRDTPIDSMNQPAGGERTDTTAEVLHRGERSGLANCQVQLVRKCADQER